MGVVESNVNQMKSWFYIILHFRFTVKLIHHFFLVHDVDSIHICIVVFDYTGASHRLFIPGSFYEKLKACVWPCCASISHSEYYLKQSKQHHPFSYFRHLGLHFLEHVYDFLKLYQHYRSHLLQTTLQQR